MSRSRTLPALAVLGIAVVPAAPQELSMPPWFELAARADQVIACGGPAKLAITRPAQRARDLLENAIALVDKSSPGDSQERKHLGAFRAGVVKRIDELTAQQAAWDLALETAGRFLDRGSPKRADQGVLNAGPLACDKDFQDLKARIGAIYAKAGSALAAGDSEMQRARSSFDLKRAAVFCQSAIAEYLRAQEIDRDDDRTPMKLQEAKALHTTLSSISSHDVVVLSNPGGARVVLKGGVKDMVCSATPCAFRFDAAYFESGGGSFEDSRRLLEAVFAEVTKDGCEAARIPITKSGKWRGSDPKTGKFTIDFYYVSTRKLEVALRSVVPRVDAGSRIPPGINQKEKLR